MYVLNFSVFQQIHCGDFAAANAFVDEFSVLKDQIGGVFWGGWGLALRGCILTLTGEAEEAAKARMIDLIAAWRCGPTSNR